MKSLYEYISESVKIAAQKNGYRLVTLVSHPGIDCKNLTEEQFCDLIYADLEKAQDEYSRLVYDERKELIKKNKELNRQRNQKLADNRYKRAKDKEAYLNKLNFASDQSDISLKKDVNITFDFHLRGYGSNTVNTDKLSVSTSKKQMKECFKEVSTSTWWDKGTGWILTYLCTETSLLPNSWGNIILLMDEKSMADKKDLDDAISRDIQNWYDSYASRGGWTGD